MEDNKKKYEEALERCKKEFNFNNLSYSHEEIRQRLERVFPELKETEDERIREELIKYLKERSHSGFNREVRICNDGIAWLEKQGKKNIPEDINKAALQYVDTCAVDGEITHDNVTEPYWNNHSMMNAYKAGWLKKQGEQKTNEIHPIFRVGDYIKNKKIGDKVLIEQLDVKSKIYFYISYDGAATIHSDFPFSKQDEWELIGQKLVGQKPAEWHREDEKNLNACLGFIPDEFLRRWLIDIIYVKYDKSTWSEEDENYENALISLINEIKSQPLIRLEDWDCYIDWLKSLKERMKGE